MSKAAWAFVGVVAVAGVTVWLLWNVCYPIHAGSDHSPQVCRSRIAQYVDPVG